jgi:hypothetical protein
MQTKTKIETLNSYQLLSEMCKVRNEQSSFYPLENPITNRVQFIINELENIGVLYVLDIFDGGRKGTRYKVGFYDALQKIKPKGYDYDFYFSEEYKKLEEQYEEEIDLTGKYVNIEVCIPAKNETNQTVMFIAHHDINNVKSENCQDNTASVCNLLNFIAELQDKDLDKNVVVVFTDCEEFGGRGARRLAEKIEQGEFKTVQFVLNLELTANGQNIIIENTNEVPLYRQPKKVLVEKCKESNLSNLIKEICKRESIGYCFSGMPFNDSMKLRDKKIDSVCIVSLPDNEKEEVIKTGRCKTWTLCHKEDDTFDKTNEEDMKKIVEFLHHFVE